MTLRKLSPVVHDECNMVDEDLHFQGNLRREVYFRPKVVVVVNDADSILSVQEQILGTGQTPEVAF